MANVDDKELEYFFEYIVQLKRKYRQYMNKPSWSKEDHEKWLNIYHERTAFHSFCSGVPASLNKLYREYVEKEYPEEAYWLAPL
ncbi:hypothetical protein [Bacillus phage YungSlug]|nr:hypothetical protein [Bacillus phage YungSlug]